MKLIPNAGALWHRLWSVRLLILASLVQAADAAVPYLMPEHPRLRLTALAMLISLAAAFARLVHQPSVHDG